MKKVLIGLLALISVSAFSQDFENVQTQNPQMEIIDQDDRVTVMYPVSQLLEREAAGDVVYFGSRKRSNNICKQLNYGSYVRGSKILIKTRAVSTNNLRMNQIGYRLFPLNRLSSDYEYPKTKIVKQITCYKID